MSDIPRTEAVRAALRQQHDPAIVDDLMFLEQWETDAPPGAAAALRMSQLRRANPDLVAAVRAELRKRVG